MDDLQQPHAGEPVDSVTTDGTHEGTCVTDQCAQCALADERASHEQSIDDLMKALAAARAEAQELRERLAKAERCHICKIPTQSACSDCRIDLAATVFVCGKKACIDEHERLYCSAKLRERLTLEKPAEPERFWDPRPCVHPVGLTTCGYDEARHFRADGSPMYHPYTPAIDAAIERQETKENA